MYSIFWSFLDPDNMYLTSQLKAHLPANKKNKSDYKPISRPLAWMIDLLQSFEV